MEPAAGAMMDAPSQNSKEKSQRNDENRTIFVGNMPYKMTWRDLKDLFSQFGNVVYAKCLVDFLTNRNKGCGFVEFEQEDDAYKAISALDSVLLFRGRTLRVSSAKQKYSHSSSKQKQALTAKCAANDNSVEADMAMQAEFKGETPIDKLVDDCLVYILLFIDPFDRIRMERVSRTWKRCSEFAFRRQQNMILRKPFRSFRAFTDLMLHKVISRCGPCLKSLDLSAISLRCGNMMLSVIASSCPNLENLDIWGAFINNKGMEKFTETCYKLKNLKVARCLRLSEKGFWYLFHNCQQLQSLDCSENVKITGKCFKYATAHFEQLNARNCKKLVDEGIIELSLRCPNLQLIDLHNCEDIRSEAVDCLVQACHKLTDVNIGGMFCYFAILSCRVIMKMANPVILTKLVCDNSLMDDQDIKCICLTCPHLVELDISCNHLSNDSVKQLSLLYNLQILSMCHCFAISSSALMDVAKNGKLKVFRAQACKRLDDELFMTIGECCTQLEELDIAGVIHVTELAILNFCECLKTQPHRKLVIYAMDNDFYGYDGPLVGYPNVSVVSKYRHLYATHNMWLILADDQPFNIGLPDWDIVREDDLLMSDDEGFDFDDIVDYDDLDLTNSDDDFLLNDDPLGIEYYERS